MHDVCSHDSAAVVVAAGLRCNCSATKLHSTGPLLQFSTSHDSAAVMVAAGFTCLCEYLMQVPLNCSSPHSTLPLNYSTTTTQLLNYRHSTAQLLPLNYFTPVPSTPVPE